MILRSLICEQVVNYFESDDWKELMRNMRRDKEVRHAHVYVDSILHPKPLLRIVAEYFKAQGLPLQRKIYLLPPGGAYGWTDIYNIHPRQDWGHFEIILRYSPDQVLVPMSPEATPTGKSVEIWDDQYMEKFYARFNFKTKLTSQDEKDLNAFFVSPEWKWHYNFMLGGSNRHSHALVESSIHPEIIQEFAIKALQARGWEVSKSVSVVYAIRGCDFGKITILLKRPEVMLELEWDFNPNVSIKPGAEPMILKSTLEDLNACMAGLNYLELDEEGVPQIIKALKARVK